MSFRLICQRDRWRFRCRRLSKKSWIELEELENGTLSPVEIAEWATPIAVVRKLNNQIRMCADFSTGLNEALKDVDYPIPNMEVIMTKFSGNRRFTQLDRTPICRYH